MSSSIFIRFDLLRSHHHFRQVFIARTISLFGLGVLGVAVPIQIYQQTQSSAYVSLALALDGVGMFIGLLLGGVWADQFERKRLILLARSLCGLGFIVLAWNASLAQPMLWLVLLASAWDGFFGALGVSALLAAMPALVGRENLMQARAISMLSMRVVSIAAPALAGMLIAASSIAWCYLIAALATALTLLPLLSLPVLPAPAANTEAGTAQQPVREFARQFWAGWQLLSQQRTLSALMQVGIVIAACSAVRSVFPQLLDQHLAIHDWRLGLLYAAVPVGASLAAVTSAWAERLAKPGLALTGMSLLSFVAIAGLGWSTQFYLSLFMLLILGYSLACAALLHYGLLQAHTEDEYMGRINGMWSALESAAETLAMLLLGYLAAWRGAAASLLLLAGLLVLVSALGFAQLRLVQQARLLQSGS